MKSSFSCEVAQRLWVTFSICVTRWMEQAVLHQLNHNRLELCLQGKGWNSSEGNCLGQGFKKAVWGMVRHVRVALTPRAGNGGNACSLSSYFLRPRVSEICLLTGTSTRRSEAGWSLQPLKSLYIFTQTAKWWQRLAMLTKSRCLLGLCI